MGRAYTISFDKKIGLFFLSVIGAYSGYVVFYESHIVSENYTNGAYNLLAGIDPYPPDWEFDPNYRNWYLYGPAFALFWRLFLPPVMGEYSGPFAWQMLSLAIFWKGFASLARVLDKEGKLLTGRWWFLALFLLANETIGSFRLMQSNALLMGMTMMAAAAYMEGRHAAAAFLLALGTHFKVSPLVLALLLFLEFRVAFIAWFAGFLLLLFLLPMLALPPDFYISVFRHWLKLHATDPAHDIFFGLENILIYYGFNADRTLLFYFMTANALAIAFVCRKSFTLSRDRFLPAVFPLAVLFMMVFNRRAEKYTFIMLAPVFTFMLHSALSARKAGNTGMARFHAGALFVSWSLVSGVYSDLYPRTFRNMADYYHLKAFGSFFMYFWAWVNAFWVLREKQSRSGS